MKIWLKLILPNRPYALRLFSYYVKQIPATTKLGPTAVALNLNLTVDGSYNRNFTQGEIKAPQLKKSVIVFWLIS
jgi:hypothetical protein